MQKIKLLWLVAPCIGLLVLLVGCSAATLSTPSTGQAPKVPAGETLYVLDGYTGNSHASQHIVSFQPGTSNSAMTLPAGLISLDHQRIYAATPQGGQTNITITNTQTGLLIRGMTIPGSYSTADQNYTQAVLSFDGHWLALRQQEQSTTSSTIALIDTQAGKLVKTIHLQGNFDLDALSPNGLNLYLLQRLGDAAGHYYVRLYLVDQNQLYAQPIIDKEDIDTRMVGTAQTRQVSPDGMIAYTLYTDVKHNIAFIHVLPLQGTELPFARCVDLPTGRSGDLLRYYSLALAPNGGALYAANAALGVVNVVTNIDTPSASIAAKVRFAPGSVSASQQATPLHNGAVVSADNRMLYFLGASGIWIVDTNGQAFKASYATQQAFTGLAVSGDGRTLFAVNPTSGITMIDASSGLAQQVAQSSVHTPWDIEWITN